MTHLGDGASTGNGLGVSLLVDQDIVSDLGNDTSAWNGLWVSLLVDEGVVLDGGSVDLSEERVHLDKEEGWVWCLVRVELGVERVVVDEEKRRRRRSKGGSFIPFSQPFDDDDDANTQATR